MKGIFRITWTDKTTFHENHILETDSELTASLVCHAVSKTRKVRCEVFCQDNRQLPKLWEVREPRKEI